MKRLICMVACLPMAACVAGSEPVGDVNSGGSEETGADDPSGTEGGSSQGNEGPGGTSVGSTDDGSGGGTMDGGSSGSADGGTGGELNEDALDAAECVAGDNAGIGAAGLNLGDWPVEPGLRGSQDLAATCTISEVDVSDGIVLTTLECMTEKSGPHTVAIGVGEPSVGTLTWATGDDVALEGSINGGAGGHVAVQAGLDLAGGAPVGGGAFAYYGIGLRAAEDGAFLFASTNQFVSAEMVAPLELQGAEGCLVDAGCGTDLDGRRQALIGEVGGDAVVVTGGRHAELSLQDGSMVVFDAPSYHEIADDCHFISVSIAARRVNL